ncbi:MAG: hypothetical protein H8F28_14240 [Fibrella sp.]|nr:hypothetical protein [Armatimonadota bacterium]
MATQRFSAPDISPATPPGRYHGYAIATGILLLGMFSVASANWGETVATPPDALVAAQERAAVSGDDELALSALEQLRSGNPENAVYSYMIAGHYARRHEWQPAIAALDRGNKATRLRLAESATSTGSYPALPVLRQLVTRCTEEATRRSDETGESLLRESGILASRLAREATPCDLPVLQNAGSAWQTVERARIAVWERDERFPDAEAARARLATRKKWWQHVNEQTARVDIADTAIREQVALQLRQEIGD